MSCYYFGCWNEPGHYLVGPGKAFVPSETSQHISYYGLKPDGSRWHLDGTLAPRVHHGKIVCLWTEHAEHDLGKECPQGQYLRHYLPNNFTALQWWDRCQGDKRGACNSTILLEGEHASTQLLALLALVFPHVLQNMIRVGVEPVEVYLG